MPPARPIRLPAIRVRRSRSTTSWLSCVRTRRSRTCAWPSFRLPPRTTPPRMENLRKALAIKPDLVEAQRAVIALDASERPHRRSAGGRARRPEAAAEGVGRLHPRGQHPRVEEGVERGRSRVSHRPQVRPGPPISRSICIRCCSPPAKDAEADSFAATWLKDHPKDRGFRLNLAQNAIGKKDYAAAAKQYKALLELEPDDALALNNLAWVAGQLKDPKALEYAEKRRQARAGQPRRSSTPWACCWSKRAIPRAAWTRCSKAVALAPDAADIRLNLARALVKDGQKDAAKKELETLAKLGDKFAAAGGSREADADPVSMARGRRSCPGGDRAPAPVNRCRSEGKSRIMTTVAVVGLGYVGLPLAVEFGKKHRTIGFDLSAEKIASYRRHVDPTGEVSTEDLRAATLLSFGTDAGRACRSGLHHRRRADAGRRSASAGLPPAARRVAIGRQRT